MIFPFLRLLWNCSLNCCMHSWSWAPENFLTLAISVAEQRLVNFQSQGMWWTLWLWRWKVQRMTILVTETCSCALTSWATPFCPWLFLCRSSVAWPFLLALPFISNACLFLYFLACSPIPVPQTASCSLCKPSLYEAHKYLACVNKSQAKLATSSRVPRALCCLPV